MKRLALVPLLVCALACPGEKKQDVATTPPPAPPVDTSTPVDLGKVKAALPPPTKEPPREQPLTPSGGGTVARTYPEAPSALMEAVQREQGATRFCYSEFGQKADPTLRGNVALAVTVSSTGISDVHVGDSRWTGNAAGSAVNRCLNQRL